MSVFGGEKRAVQRFLSFIGQFLRNPLQIGAVAPSSRFLCEAMLADLATKKLTRVIEFGPGTGSFTKDIIRVIPAQCQLTLFEPNPRFREDLAARFPKAMIIGDVAENLPNYSELASEQIDLIVSGLPFSLMPEHEVCKTIDAAYRALKQGGEFRTFVYEHTRVVSKVRRFVADLEKRFREVETSVVLQNLPPARVLICRK